MTSEPDVIVIGDGPAGASTAFRLAAKDISVWVVAQGGRAPAPAGETLPPRIKNEIAKLGASAARIGAGALDSYGIEARWGGSDNFHSHLFDAHGNGWHVDHAALCTNLLGEARAAGARVLPGTTVSRAERSQRRWCLRLETSSGACEVSSRFIVDASGRAATLRRITGVGRRRFDALCGFAAVFPGRAMPCTLRVVSASYGWWYVSPLPDDRVLVCLMSDADIARRLGAHRSCGWLALVEEAGWMRSGLLSSASPGPVHVLPCETAILERVTGDGWAAVGDAACVFDPLASAGVMKALHTGRIAADRICEYLYDGTNAGLESYGEQMLRDFDWYQRTRQVQYGAERRWLDHPFWTRRVRVTRPGSFDRATSDAVDTREPA